MTAHDMWKKSEPQYMPEPVTTMPDGYYWAKWNDDRADNEWIVVQVFDTGNGQLGMSKKVACCGDDICMGTDRFTFGPRIEEPAE